MGDKRDRVPPAQLRANGLSESATGISTATVRGSPAFYCALHFFIHDHKIAKWFTFDAAGFPAVATARRYPTLGELPARRLIWRWKR